MGEYANYAFQWKIYTKFYKQMFIYLMHINACLLNIVYMLFICSTRRNARKYCNFAVFTK